MFMSPGSLSLCYFLVSWLKSTMKDHVWPCALAEGQRRGLALFLLRHCLGLESPRNVCPWGSLNIWRFFGDAKTSCQKMQEKMFFFFPSNLNIYVGSFSFLSFSGKTWVMEHFKQQLLFTELSAILSTAPYSRYYSFLKRWREETQSSHSEAKPGLRSSSVWCKVCTPWTATEHIYDSKKKQRKISRYHSGRYSSSPSSHLLYIWVVLVGRTPKQAK